MKATVKIVAHEAEQYSRKQETSYKPNHRGDNLCDTAMQDDLCPRCSHSSLNSVLSEMDRRRSTLYSTNSLFSTLFNIFSRGALCVGPFGDNLGITLEMLRKMMKQTLKKAEANENTVFLFK